MAKKFIVNPFSITYEQIQNNLRLMIAKDKETFTDFFNDGSGSSVIDIASAIGTMFAFHIIAQRKEFTLEHAVSYKSLIGNAYDKGYNVTRGNNLKVTLSVVPSTTGVLKPWTTVGSYEEFDITLTKEAKFQAGVPTTLEVVIGNRKTENKVVTSNNIILFRFTADDITDDVRLFLNDDEIPYSTQIKDLLNDKYLMQSNSYGSVNVFYLQKGSYKYKTGDTLTLDYISRNTVDINSVTASSFYLSDFTVNQVALASNRTGLESKDDIRVNAALHAETSGVIKARADFKKVIKELDKTIKSIDDEDIQPGRIGIVILKEDYTSLTEEDKERYEKLVSNNNVSGVANLYYTDARCYTTPLNVSITPQDDTTTESTLLSQTLENISSYEGVLGKFINFDDMEDYIEKEISGVKVARISIESKPWEQKNYRVADTCIASKFNNHTYYVDSIIYKTGDSAPNWNSPEDGYIVDGDILWKEYTGDPEGIMIWKPGVQVKLGKLVVDTLDEERRVFECVGYTARTGTLEPTWSSGEATLFDNQVVWAKVNPEPVTLESWSSNKLLKVGQTIMKRYNEGTEETYEDQTVYNYFSETFGGNFYTAQPLDNSVECFLDETLGVSIGVASDINFDDKIVTITPKTSEESKTGSYEDFTTYKYSGGVSGVFYTKSALNKGVECFSDSSFKQSIGTVQNLNAEGKKVQITDESKVETFYYKFVDYAMPSDSTEPDWSDKTLEGYIEDGDRLLWKESSYPIRFIQLGKNSYAKFESSVTIN